LPARAERACLTTSVALAGQHTCNGARLDVRSVEAVYRCRPGTRLRTPPYRKAPAVATEKFNAAKAK
jgi:hypothetical protein